MRPLLAALAILLALARPAGAETVTGLPLVVDGDSLRLPGVEVRLFGIDAPEALQTCTRAGKPYACGREATEHLRALIAGRPVVCAHKDTDRYGRFVGRCEAGGVDLSAAQVEGGHALAFRRFSLQYAPEEDRARMARRGMWAGEFVPPWEWRAAKRAGQ